MSEQTLTKQAPDFLEMLAEHKYAQALEQIDQRLEQDPNDADLLAYKAGCHFEKGEHSLAKQVVRQALELNPIQEDALIIQGSLYQVEGDLERAFSSLQQAYQLNPSRPDLLFKIAQLYVERGALAQAIAIYQQMLRLDPYFAVAYRNLGVLYLETRQPELAIEALRQATAFNDTDSESRFELACLLFERDQFAAAIPYFQEVLYLSDEADSLHNLYLCYMQLEDYTEAANTMEIFIKAQPDSIDDCYYHLALAQFRQGQLSSALQNLKKSFGNDPLQSENQFLLGQIYQADQKPMLAKMAYGKVLKLEPEHEAAQLALASLSS